LRRGAPRLSLTRSAAGVILGSSLYIHATILNQFGLNQDALSYLHQGRKERLTEIHGNVIQQIV
jgi:Protein of unknown function (DUF1501)